jgi:hypothetical protein
MKADVKFLVSICLSIVLFTALLIKGNEVLSSYTQAQLQKEELDHWRNQLQDNNIRQLQSKVLELETRLNFGGVAPQNADVQPPPQRSFASDVDDKSVRVVSRDIPHEQLKHYFNGANDSNFSKITKGIPQAKVRELCGGKNIIPFETVRNGFTFALNNERSAFYTVENWFPANGVKYDFFVSDNGWLLSVGYDQGVADVINQFPIAKQNTLTSAQAGVEIKEINNGRALQMTVTPGQMSK